MFLGLRTVIYRVKPADLAPAKDWFSKILAQKPYFDEPFYVGFSVGGFELGIDPNEEKIKHGDDIHAYWGVNNIKEAVAHCVKTGGETVSEVRDVGEGIKVAMIKNPFGHQFGLIENPHFKAAK